MRQGLLFFRQRQSSFNQSMSLWLKFRYITSNKVPRASKLLLLAFFTDVCHYWHCDMRISRCSITYPVLLEHILLSGVEKAFVCVASRYQSTTLSCRPPRHHYVRPCQELRGRAQLAVVRVDSGCQVNHVPRVPRAPNLAPSPPINRHTSTLHRCFWFPPLRHLLPVMRSFCSRMGRGVIAYSTMREEGGEREEDGVLCVCWPSCWWLRVARSQLSPRPRFVKKRFIGAKCNNLRSSTVRLPHAKALEFPHASLSTLSIRFYYSVCCCRYHLRALTARRQFFQLPLYHLLPQYTCCTSVHTIT